jgi:hypothetical protein
MNGVVQVLPSSSGLASARTSMSSSLSSSRTRARFNERLQRRRICGNVEDGRALERAAKQLVKSALPRRSRQGFGPARVLSAALSPAGRGARTDARGLGWFISRYAMCSF